MPSNEVNISGFMFIRDAIQLSYPVIPCIQSILPVVDEFVVNVGPDDDGTLDLIRSIDDPKIRIVRSSWNPHMNTGALVYAQQTNIAMFNCIGRWAIYMQADEIIHEDDHDLIRQNLSRYADDPRVDGIALREINFYGDGQTIISKATRRRRFWIIKPHHFVLSRGDAAGFTVHPKYKEASRPLNVVDSEIRLFNYSAVVTPEQMRTKIERQQKRDWSDKSFNEENNDLYKMMPRQFVARYDGTHPAVMADLLANHPVTMDLDSPGWRTQLTKRERKKAIKVWLASHVSERFIRPRHVRFVKP